MTNRKQWAITVAICTMAAACAMFSGPTIKDGKICEKIDFGDGVAFEVCAGTATEMATVKRMAAERRERLAR